MLCWVGSSSELAGVGTVESESLLLLYRLWLAMLAERAFWVYGDSMRAGAGIGEPDMIFSSISLTHVELASSTGRKPPAEKEGVDVIMEISSAAAIASSSSAGAAAVSASLLAYGLEVLMGRKQLCRLQRSGPRLEMGEGDSGRKPVEQKTLQS